MKNKKLHKEDDLCPTCKAILEKNHICIDARWDEDTDNKKTYRYKHPYKRGGAKRTQKF